MIGSQWWEVVVGRCQVTAGEVLRAAPVRVLDNLRDVLSAVPECLTGSQQLLVRSVLPQTMGRIVRQYRVDNHPDVAREFLLLCSLPWGPEWRTQWKRVVDSCVHATEGRHSEFGNDQTTDDRVRRIMCVIARRHIDPRLTLGDVARDVRLSPWHVVRVLRQGTGAGFVTHVHRYRLAAAERLLAESALSVKEIAGAVGYAHPSQLSRHFRRLHGLTPIMFRASRRRGVMSA